MKIVGVISVIGFEEEQKIDQSLFGKFTINDKPYRFSLGTEVKIRKGVVIRKTGYYIRETVGSFQHLGILIDIKKNGDIGITGNYLYNLLKNNPDSKLQIGTKQVSISKDAISKAMREEFNKLKKQKSNPKNKKPKK